MKNKKQTTLIAVLVTALVFGAAITAYAVYDNHQKSKEEDQRSAQAKEDNDKSENVDDNKEKQDPKRTVADWTMFKSDDFTMPVPDGWHIVEYKIKSDMDPRGYQTLIAEDINSQKESLVYKDGVPAKVETIKRDKPTNVQSLLVVSYHAKVRKDSMELTFGENPSAKTTEVGNLLYIGKTEIKGGGVAPAPVGSIVHHYMVKKNNSDNNVSVQYIVEPDMKDYSSQFEKSIMQLKFL